MDTDRLTSIFFHSLSAGEKFKLYNGKIFSVESKTDNKMKLVVGATPVILHKMFGMWITSPKSKKMTQQDSIFNNLWRDVEGEILMNVLNENNPLHEYTQVYKKAMAESNSKLVF